MNTIEDLLRRLKRRERLGITPLEKAGTKPPGYDNAPSPDQAIDDPTSPQVPGTKDRMPGAYPYGRRQRLEDRREGGRWRREELRRFFKKYEGVI